jgi:hypothetical protein
MLVLIEGNYPDKLKDRITSTVLLSCQLTYLYRRITQFTQSQSATDKNCERFLGGKAFDEPDREGENLG